MKREISTPLTFFLKFIASSLNIVALIIITIVISIKDVRSLIPVLIFISLPLFGIYKSLIRLKKISIEDDYIYISNFFKEIKIHKSEIQKVTTLCIRWGGSIWIHFKNKSAFGKFIVFTPKYSINPFSPLDLDVIKFLILVNKYDKNEEER